MFTKLKVTMPKSVTHLVQELRQRMYPTEFRIAAPVWPAELRDALESIAEPGTASPKLDHPADATEEVHIRLLAELSTELWRLRQKMNKADNDQPPDDLRRFYRHVEVMWDVLNKAGIEIHDVTGKMYDGGMALNVVAFQPMPGLGRDTIIETLKPAINYKTQPIQLAQVIVGTPERPSAPDEASPADVQPTTESADTPPSVNLPQE